MSVSDKQRRLNTSITRRKVDCELNDSSVSKWFLLSCCFLITVSLVAGVWIGSQKPALTQNINSTYTVDGYSFHLVSDKKHEKMQGNWGYTYLHSKHVWLNEDLLDNGLFPEQFMETCNHELLHSYGVSSNHHGKIDIFEGQIQDPICQNLKEKVVS